MEIKKNKLILNAILFVTPSLFGNQEQLQHNLWEAIDENDIAAVEKLIQHVDLNERYITGDTPLLQAIREGNIAIIRLLLSIANLDPNKQSEIGSSPLIETLTTAANTSNYIILELLLADKRVDVNKPNKFGDTPLTAAITEATDAHNPHIVSVLLANDRINPNKPDAIGNTPLMEAINQLNPTLVRLLLLQPKIKLFNLYQENDEGITALEMADETKNKEIIALIEDAIRKKQKGTAKTIMKTRGEVYPNIAQTIEKY
ncbi:MAG: ankyrin repeat domain-containing protein [Candidatus Babeliales bacterium]